MKTEKPQWTFAPKHKLYCIFNCIFLFSLFPFSSSVNVCGSRALQLFCVLYVMRACNNMQQTNTTNTNTHTNRLNVQAVYMTTTVPQNIKGTNIMGSHTPTRSSLRHSRMLVINKNYQGKSHMDSHRGILLFFFLHFFCFSFLFFSYIFLLLRLLPCYRELCSCSLYFFTFISYFLHSRKFMYGKYIWLNVAGCWTTATLATAMVGKTFRNISLKK